MANGWGGKRANQTGRPRLEVPRKQRQTRATDEEWDIIRAFAAIVRKDPERAARMMKTE